MTIHAVPNTPVGATPAYNLSALRASTEKRLSEQKAVEKVFPDAQYNAPENRYEANVTNHKSCKTEFFATTASGQIGMRSFVELKRRGKETIVVYQRGFTPISTSKVVALLNHYKCSLAELEGAGKLGAVTG